MDKSAGNDQGDQQVGDRPRSFYERAARRMGERAGGFGQGGYGSYGARQGWSPATQPQRTEPSYERGEREPASGAAANWQRAAITAGEIMTTDLRLAGRDTTLQEIARIMKEENCGVVPVVDGQGRLVGVVTDRDLVLRAGAAGKSFVETRAAEAMTDDIDAVTPDEELQGVIALMSERQVRRVPVVDRDDRLLGLISMADIANRADCDDELREALERISSRRPFWSRLET